MVRFIAIPVMLFTTNIFSLEYMAEEDLNLYIEEDQDQEESHIKRSAMAIQQEICQMLMKEFGEGEVLPPKTIKNLLLQVNKNL